MDRAPTGRFEIELPSELASVVAARRIAEQAAKEWKLGQAAAEDLSLLTSELVTNAVLHAHTDVRVRVQRFGSGARLEVVDGDSRLPVVDLEHPENLLATRSMSGRGLAVVAAVSDRWGAEPLGQGGKTIWAEVGTGRRRAVPLAGPARSGAPLQYATGASRREAPAEWGPVPAGARHAPLAGRVRMTAEAVEVGRTPIARAGPDLDVTALSRDGQRVHVIGVPVRILVESLNQYSDLQREMAVVGLDPEAPERTGRTAEGLEMALALDCLRRIGSDEAHAALGRGDERVDFDVTISDEQMTIFERLGRRLRAAARMMRQGNLLTLPPSDEVLDFRRWCEDEIAAQLAGRPARPYPG